MKIEVITHQAQQDYVHYGTAFIKFPNPVLSVSSGAVA